MLFNNCNNQVLGQSIPVANLKENKKIDDLMSRLLKDKRETVQIDKNISSDSCWYLQIFRFDESNASFQIKPASRTAINFFVNNLERHKQRYGFFSYKGNFVLVWCDEDWSDYFSTSDSYSSFKFLFHSTFSNDPDEERQYYWIHYKITSGVISVEAGPPPVAAPANK